jgi:hypothetical protein
LERFELVNFAQLANAPMSNSLGLKYSGGGGAGAMTCLGSGGPANAAIACEKRTAPTRGIIFFMAIGFLIYRDNKRETPVQGINKSRFIVQIKI